MDTFWRLFGNSNSRARQQDDGKLSAIWVCASLCSRRIKLTIVSRNAPSTTWVTIRLQLLRIQCIILLRDRTSPGFYTNSGRWMKRTTDEIDLHRLTVEEAVPLVDKFLHESFKTGLYRVWIIHGKGTGALRSAVRHHLAKHPLVIYCSAANGDRGGAGATQVELTH